MGFYAEDPRHFRFPAYRKVFNGKYPIELLKHFPWQHLQALRPQLRGTSAGA
jgi:hypothetical protein